MMSDTQTRQSPTIKSFLEIAYEIHSDLAEFARGIVWRRLASREELGWIWSKIIDLIPEAQRLNVDVSAWIELERVVRGPHLDDPRVIQHPDAFWERVAVTSATVIHAMESERAKRADADPAGKPGPTDAEVYAVLDRLGLPHDAQRRYDFKEFVSRHINREDLTQAKSQLGWPDIKDKDGKTNLYRVVDVVRRFYARFSA
jgi:hypothetical protein